MSYLASSCNCSSNNSFPLPSQCKACGWVNESLTPEQRKSIKQQMNEAEQRRIWNVSRVPSSLYSMSLGVANVCNGISNDPKPEYGDVNWNQMSDRAVPGVVHRNVPRKRTRAIPGQQSASGQGVDVKHGSYARYLARKKGPILKQYGAPSSPPNPSPLYGNKYYKLGLVAGCKLIYC